MEKWMRRIRDGESSASPVGAAVISAALYGAGYGIGKLFR